MAIDTARRLVPATRRRSGRAIAIRSTKRPIAIITLRKSSQRATSSLGVVAVSATDGTGNWGCGPAFGPIAKVYAPWTGCPSTEIARQ